MNVDEQKKIEAMLQKQESALRKMLDNTKLYSKNLTEVIKKEENIFQIKKKINVIEKEISNTETGTKRHKALEEVLAEEQLQLDILKKTNKVLDITVASFGSLWDGIKMSGKYFLEMDKASKMVSLSMGINVAQGRAMREGLFKVSQITNALGVSSADLAKMQGIYADNIGRAVMLSKDALEGMAGLAKGTALGVEGATSLVSEMDLFGISALDATKQMQSMFNLGHSMAINSNSALKELQKSLKQGQSYNFKDGVKGIIQMALMAEKFKISLSDVAPVADKLMNVEGAVETSAQLQVLGGSFARMAQPLKLMFLARNDVKALGEEIINLTKYSAQWNKEQGQAKMTGLQMNLLREAAKALNIDYGTLVASAYKFAQYNQAGSEIKVNIKDQTTKEYIKTVSQWQSDRKGFSITISPYVTKLLSELTDKDIQIIEATAKAKTSFKEATLASQSFDDAWKNVVNSFKSYLLPFFNGLSQGILEGMGSFADWAKKDNFATKLSNFGKTVGESIGKFGSILSNFIGKNPISAAVTALASASIFTVGRWYFFGTMLAKGWLDAIGGGMMGEVGMIGSTPKSSRAPIGFYPSAVEEESVIASQMGGKIGKRPRFFAEGGVGRSMGAKLGYSAAATLSGAYLQGTDNKVANIAGGALQGAAYGMMILSPIPGIGPLLGAGIGALVGGGLSAWNAYSSNKSQGTEHQDFILRPGHKPESFSKDDIVMGIKKGGVIDNVNNQQNNNNPSTIHHTFDTIKIEIGTVTVKSDSSQIKIDLDKDPSLAREIANHIHEATRKAIGGGVLNSNRSTI